MATVNMLFTYLRITAVCLLSVTVVSGLVSMDAHAADGTRTAVTIENDSTKRINITGSFDTQSASGVSRLSKQIFQVPRGKRLLIDYSSVEMDANVSNPVDYDFEMYTYLTGSGPQGASFALGTLTRGPNTSRGPPYYSLSKATPIFFHHKNAITLELDNKHAAVDITFARVTYAFSCRLVDVR